ncbi:hypothetical protein BT63DRAFT_96977 [Microthyrium microscopicum]|uniref:Uncharacterized protein n=1 Tax=Microthyrium microscopicum TaxID=703497 RepID=A0A6A6TXC8_9PEZI|nr:hypothetical protein BT63DRAFT_96977 [Microthyrium microscopicum]
MPSIQLNISRVRDGKPSDLITYFNELREDHSDTAVYQSFSNAVGNEELRPGLFSIIFSWMKSIEIVALCLQSEKSQFIRRQAIKHFGRALAKPKEWESAWRAVGGSQGLVNLFSRISVLEVKALSGAIGRCNRGQHDLTKRETVIEELVHALVPSHYGSRLQSQDKRPIQHHYGRMVTACSSLFVETLLKTEDKSNPLFQKLPTQRLIRTHPNILQERILETITGSGPSDRNINDYVIAFTHTEPPKATADPKISASMAFAEKMLHIRLERLETVPEDKSWPTFWGFSETDLFKSLFRRYTKKKLPEAKIHGLILLTLRYIELKPDKKQDFNSGYPVTSLWHTILEKWKRLPEFYGDALQLAFRLELGGSQRSLCQDFLRASQHLKLEGERRWTLFQLFCLRTPKVEIDLSTTKSFKPLAKIPWSVEFFYYLEKDHSLAILKALYAINKEFSFLNASHRNTILTTQDIQSQRNFNALLLITILERGSYPSLERAENMVNELRKKAATSKEQPDRAEFAKAAADLAIASGDLDLYGDLITWQQRYVRDPLTVKAIFSHNAVATAEGIELLSGMPKPLPQDLTLSEAATTVSKANEILLEFQSIMKLAKKEPSFQAYDWHGVSSLFGSALSERLVQTQEFQKNIKHSELDLYSAIWVGTLDMLGSVNSDFLHQARGTMNAIFKTLPPSAIATASKAMLQNGSERRKRQDRQPEDDTLEIISYEILLQLAKSDKPELAQRLVLQTILDRPDASSWHRLLLSPGFMKKLSANDAQRMLLAFATAIGEKLEEQSYVKVGEAAPARSAPPQSLVKVTTVKYLAQLLDNAEFISADAAIDVLVELFKAGTHRDIRLATLDSLLSLLNNICGGSDDSWKSNPQMEKILFALDTVVPVIGSINENRPPSAADWAEAKETGTLPSIVDASLVIPPLMNAVFAACSNHSRYKNLAKLADVFVSRYIVPTVAHSKAEHTKWLTLFLVKYNPHLTVKDIPSTPLSVEIWHWSLQNYWKYMPQTVLDDYNKHIVMTIAPSSSLTEFNRSLKDDIDVRNTPEVQHWLSVYGQDSSTASSRATETQFLLEHAHFGYESSVVTDGISFNHVRDIINSHAELFLDGPERFRRVWSILAEDCSPSKKGIFQNDRVLSRTHFAAWQTTGKVILEDLIELVATRKRKDPRRILPSTLKPRLHLLPYPYHPEPAQLEQECSALAGELEGLLVELLKGQNNALRWPKIAEDARTVSSFLVTDEERIQVAICLGSSIGRLDTEASSERIALDLVKLSVAFSLMENRTQYFKKTPQANFSPAKLKLIEQLKECARLWEKHSDEGVRDMVFRWKDDHQDLWTKLMKA